ncbi:DUF4168 domain-containing protein [Chelativorans sp. Marseille-P2723]|uniref:DUF4168 domain-containing protein n=1 Tax=Chelativorans sp. Marseille-P2723 TaxID=2709133 RepID=UPI00156DAFA2|nr:DUF4168 domain-containing protein [Chelativorans sp. Marseille-P2723]
MILNHSKRLVVAAGLFAGIAFVPAALAQDAGQPVEPAVEAPAITDEKLQSFAAAFVEVEAIKQQYTQRLQSAASETAQQEIQNEAGQKMLEAVEATDGISLEEYNQIITSAQSDPAFAQKLTDAIGKVSE